MRAKKNEEMRLKSQSNCYCSGGGVQVLRRLKYRFVALQKMNNILYLFAVVLLIFGATSCKEDKGDEFVIAPAENVDAAKVTAIDPLVGGIATPIIIEGEGFGTDTTKLHVRFVNDADPNDVTNANIIGVNGKMIYFNTPKLTHKDNLRIEIELTDKNGKTRILDTSSELGMYKYKTEQTVSTVAGIPFADQGAAYTSPGTLSNATFSCPMFICVDAEKNVVIIERAFAKNKPEMDTGLQPKIDKNNKKENTSGIISLLNEKSDDVRILKEDAPLINAPTISPNGKTAYVPHDVKFGYYSMSIEDGYGVKQRSMRPPTKNYEDKDNWKFSFVTDPKNTDKYAPVYTVMYNGELIKINPLNNETEVIAKLDIRQGSDIYLAFNPKEDNVLYMSANNTHSIYRVDLKKDSIYAEPYAGLAVVKTVGKFNPSKDGEYAGGVLSNARFFYPRQITFDDEGVMYIADCANHCIRSIKVGADGTNRNVTVDRVVGTQGNPGFTDGGPEISQLCYPMGIAKAFDGTIYIADTRNYAIRKLVIQ